MLQPGARRRHDERNHSLQELLVTPKHNVLSTLRGDVSVKSLKSGWNGAREKLTDSTFQHPINILNSFQSPRKGGLDAPRPRQVVAADTSKLHSKSLTRCLFSERFPIKRFVQFQNEQALDSYQLNFNYLRLTEPRSYLKNKNQSAGQRRLQLSEFIRHENETYARRAQVQQTRAQVVLKRKAHSAFEAQNVRLQLSKSACALPQIRLQDALSTSCEHAAPFSAAEPNSRLKFKRLDFAPAAPLSVKSAITRKSSKPGQTSLPGLFGAPSGATTDKQPTPKQRPHARNQINFESKFLTNKKNLVKLQYAPPPNDTTSRLAPKALSLKSSIIRKTFSINSPKSPSFPLSPSLKGSEFQEFLEQAGDFKKVQQTINQRQRPSRVHIKFTEDATQKKKPQVSMKELSRKLGYKKYENKMPSFLKPFKHMVLDKFTRGPNAKITPLQEFLLNSSLGMLTLHENIAQPTQGEIRVFPFDNTKRYTAVPQPVNKSNRAPRGSESEGS